MATVEHMLDVVDDAAELSVVTYAPEKEPSSR